jgi:hypothetical protein
MMIAGDVFHYHFNRRRERAAILIKLDIPHTRYTHLADKKLTTEKAKNIYQNIKHTSEAESRVLGSPLSALSALSRLGDGLDRRGGVCEPCRVPVDGERRRKRRKEESEAEEEEKSIFIEKL